ncbi:C2 domain-containing protein [Streptomyces sp. NPDC058412]|uniref:C2 domain-containing protein n=1 Tax=Streptomyces sp. NPDC058412 TaxID=3346486 RepID=UPI003662143A
MMRIKYSRVVIALTALACCAVAAPAAPAAQARPAALSSLRVTVVEARNLHHEDGLLGKNDPYAVVSVGAQRHATEVRTNAGSRATWNETFDFELQESDRSMTLVVYEKDLLKDDLIGRAIISLEAVRREGTTSSWYPIGEGAKARGEVLVDMSLQSG